MDQLCFNTSAQVMAYISMGITILNAVLNVVPDPDKIAKPRRPWLNQPTRCSHW